MTLRGKASNLPLHQISLHIWRQVQKCYMLLQRGGFGTSTSTWLSFKRKTHRFSSRWLFTLEKPHYPVPRIAGVFWNPNKWCSRKPHFAQSNKWRSKAKGLLGGPESFQQVRNTGPDCTSNTAEPPKKMRFRGCPISGPTKPVEFVPASGIPKSTESGDSPTSGFLKILQQVELPRRYGLKGTNKWTFEGLKTTLSPATTTSGIPEKGGGGGVLASNNPRNNHQVGS